MTDKIAIKRLSSSDLTFFEWHVKNSARTNKSNQKSINLNADVFVDKLFPNAAALAAAQDNYFPVIVKLHGPGLTDPQVLTRKITKQGAYKNWRLNGEFVHNPEGDDKRYNILKEGDLAVMFFSGISGPTHVNIVLLSDLVDGDKSLHRTLSPFVPSSGSKSMRDLAVEQLMAAVDSADVPDNHPIRQYLTDTELDVALTDAAYGNAAATGEIRRRAARKISPEELARIRENNARIGHDGEALVSLYLENLVESGEILEVEWTSSVYATSPFDFKINKASGESVKVEVKSTENDFGNLIHISAAEIIEASQSKEQYDLYRISSITEDGATLHICEDLRAFADTVRGVIQSLPEGVTPDGFSVDPKILNFGKGIHIVRRDDPEQEET